MFRRRVDQLELVQANIRTAAEGALYPGLARLRAGTGELQTCDELLFKRQMTSDYHKQGCRTIAHRPGVRSILPSCSNTFRAFRIVVRLTYSSLANSLSVGSWLPV